MSLFADIAAGFAACVSLLVVALGTNPTGVLAAVVLCLVSVLWISRHAFPGEEQP